MLIDQSESGSIAGSGILFELVSVCVCVFELNSKVHAILISKWLFIDAGEIFTSLKPQLCETHQKKNNEKTTHEAIGRNRVSWAIIITLNEKKAQQNENINWE